VSYAYTDREFKAVAWALREAGPEGAYREGIDALLEAIGQRAMVLTVELPALCRALCKARELAGAEEASRRQYAAALALVCSAVEAPAPIYDIEEV